MLSASYPAHYHDHLGEEETTIENGPGQMHMALRGVAFQSANLLWHPEGADLPLSAFTFSRMGTLSDYTLEWDMPISVVHSDQLLPATLHVQHVLGGGGEIGSELTITLSVADQWFTTQGKAATSRFVQALRRLEEEEDLEIYSFERALGILHEQLPEGMYLKICEFCAFSEYNPTGPVDLFGNLECYKKNKQAFLSISSKEWRRQHSFKGAFWKLQRDMVQETYCCSEFQRRSSDHEGPPYPSDPL